MEKLEMLEKPRKKRPDFSKIFSSPLFKDITHNLDDVLCKIEDSKSLNPILEIIYIDIYKLLNFKLNFQEDGTLKLPVFEKSYFNRRYRGIAPWEFHGEQPIIKELLQKNAIRGRILDVGCGTGDDAINIASNGFDITGIDFSESAIERAIKRAREQEVSVNFVEQDIFNLTTDLGKFDTIIDCGLYHGLNITQKPVYAEILYNLLNKNGVFYLICFSDLMPKSISPDLISQDEIKKFFSNGWEIDSIQKRNLIGAIGEALVWLATIKKL